MLAFGMEIVNNSYRLGIEMRNGVSKYKYEREIHAEPHE